ncbi:hypothetical protein EG329_013722 [Mollisiaceae sp. DMI_Dod_QoI]|nr:hypothetical protein EG329_013722 [Helotiales sp. DMI_Dod_QoI]
MSEKYDEDKTASPTDDSTLDLPPNKEWAPISGAPSNANSRSNSRARGGSMSLRSVSRIRSNNGYGCDDHDDDTEQGEMGDAEGGVAEKDPFEVRWENGDQDPMCPRSMSLARKWLVVIIVSASSLCVTCTSSIYTSTYAQIEKDFHVSREVATLGLSLFIMGLGLGPMLLGPLSEFYGRRPIYLVSFSMFIIWIIPSAVAQNIQTMLVARFFDGLAGSAFLSVAGGTVGDMFNRETLQLPMLIYTGSPFIGPSIGPLIGGFINQYADWRWTYYVLLIWSGVNLGMIALFVPETYHPVILRSKAQKLRKETGDERWKAPMEKTNKSIPRTIAYSLLRPAQLLIFEPMREERTGEIGGSEPEYRLPPAIVGAVLVPIGLFMFAWTTYSSVHWIVPIIGSAIFGMGTLLVFSGIFTFLVDAYPLYGASALAANSFARSSFGAIFPLFGVQMYHKLGDQWATSLLAFLTVAMMPFPYLFFKYGKKIRGKSRFATA